ncbi:OmpA/MotB family protein [Salinibacter ruber]|jgi:outer membrane protein OmpA-like peptidoglycan-associated protein|uniref:OmpA/MotB family protein n=1 Tax=Salinibacter ruber TaxID=146919 RepID=UPI002167B531|nr:OmpA family protein [Salinibacter ruber]MCS4056772.1 outer membrane protein OmpA-like peptidoglycan-associated protein [Salinibacter ruber]
MTSGESGNPFALSIGDLMAALLLVFILLVGATLLMVKEDEERTVELISEYQALQDSLYNDLRSEFEGDLERWSAVIERETLAIRFQEPEVLFGKGEATVRPRFEQILDNFFPRYIRILRQPEYRSSIREIRIEGHTSSEWAPGSTEEEAYFNNMRLSQDRTRTVLRYVLGTLDRREATDWTQNLITANGLSSSELIYTESGKEDREASRRVEFRVRTNAESQLEEILSQLAQNQEGVRQQDRE